MSRSTKYFGMSWAERAVVVKSCGVVISYQNVFSNNLKVQSHHARSERRQRQYNYCKGTPPQVRCCQTCKIFRWTQSSAHCLPIVSCGQDLFFGIKKNSFPRTLTTPQHPSLLLGSLHSSGVLYGTHSRACRDFHQYR